MAAMKKKQVKHASYQDAESVKQYLKQMINGLEQGDITLSSGDDSLVLKPHGLMAFSITANQSKSKQMLRFKLEWVPNEAASEIEDDELFIE